jgi:hypothetical protein
LTRLASSGKVFGFMMTRHGKEASVEFLHSFLAVWPAVMRVVTDA